jgi:hypothetical protein
MTEFFFSKYVVIIEYIKVACLLPSWFQYLSYEGKNMERKRLGVQLIHMTAKLTISQGLYLCIHHFLYDAKFGRYVLDGQTGGQILAMDFYS